MLNPTLEARTRAVRALFRSFRQTRPFWGGLWLIVGGWLVLRLSQVSIAVIVSSGMIGLGGWLTGGGMICAGLLTWTAPVHKNVAGLLGMVLALVSLVVSNLGGLFIGMLVGLIGASMVLGWGVKSRTAERQPELVEC